MKQYLVIAEQNGGCDYTIVCGVKTIFVEGCIDSIEQYIKEKILRNDTEDGNIDCDYELCEFIENHFSGTSADIDSLDIYEINDSVSINISKLLKQKREQLVARKQKKENDEELALYKKLKAKFEKPKVYRICETCELAKEESEFSSVYNLKNHCKFCASIIIKERDKIQKKSEAKIRRLNEKISKLLKAEGWEFNAYLNIYLKNKYKVRAAYGYICIEVWDLIRAGKRKPSWRAGSVEELEGKISEELMKLLTAAL